MILSYNMKDVLVLRITLENGEDTTLFFCVLEPVFEAVLDQEVVVGLHDFEEEGPVADICVIG